MDKKKVCQANDGYTLLSAVTKKQGCSTRFYCPRILQFTYQKLACIHSIPRLYPGSWNRRQQVRATRSGVLLLLDRSVGRNLLLARKDDCSIQC
jgi:hypothetical protein